MRLIQYYGQPTVLLAFVFYNMALKLIAVHEVYVLRRVGHKIRFFDGDKHARDGVPDVGVRKTVQSLLFVIIFRPMLILFLTFYAKKGAHHR